LADEIALYDRQIRLWGMKAQEKIRHANILLITMKAIANEIAKNLVLAGIRSLTILDGDVVTEADLGSQFFLSEEDGHVGMNRAQAASAQIQKLNPRVKVHVDPEDVISKGASYFQAFDIVIATDLDPKALYFINTATRMHGKAFYAAGTHGLYGFIFSDLIEHDYVIQRNLGSSATQIKQETRTRSVVDVKMRKESGTTMEVVTKREIYSTWFLASDAATLPEEFMRHKRRLKAVTPVLTGLRALWEFMTLNNNRFPNPNARPDMEMFTRIATSKHAALGLPSETLTSGFLRSFLQNIGSEITPVAAILGGQLAQDVINVLGQTQQPIQNMVIFDGNTLKAEMYALHPEGSLGRGLLHLADTDAVITNGGALVPTEATVVGIDGSTPLSSSVPVILD
jgi:ubiquitin-like 1-activating enzyme E1 A